MKLKEKKKNPLRFGLYAVVVVILAVLGAFVSRDTTPPEITVIPQTVDYGTTLLANQMATVQDNRSADNELTVLTETQNGIIVSEDGKKVTFNEPGEYEMELLAVDKAENESHASVKISVTDSIQPVLESYADSVSIGYGENLRLSLEDGTNPNTVTINASDKTKLQLHITDITSSDTQGEKSYKQASETSAAFSDIGTYQVTFSVTDAFNNASEGQIQVQVVDKVSPEIHNLNQKVVLKDNQKSADYLSGVSADDEIDGDLTPNLIQDDSRVLYGTVGEYKAYVSVTDQAGNQTLKTVTVQICDTTAPELSLTKTSFTLTEGDSVPNYKSTASAKDAVDGNLSELVEVDDSAVDYDSPGTYTVVYRVSDSAGNTISQNASVVVKAKQNVNSGGSSSGGSSGSDSSDSDSSSQTVLITRTGECYHTHKCGNGTYFEVSLQEAKNRGLRPCKKCY